MNDAFALALGQMQSAAHRAWATKRALELSFTRGLDLSPRGIDFEGRAFVTNVAVAASSPRVSVNLEPHDGTKGTDDKVSRPIVDSNRASPMKSVPRRWATRWNELKTMRKHVLSQLEKQNHFYVPEK